MKILYIYSDKKFLNASTQFSKYPNVLIDSVYIGQESIEDDSIKCIPFSKKNCKYVASLSNAYDIVILNSLCLQHALICTKIDKKVIVLWRFFGAELYPFLYREMLSPENLKYFEVDRVHMFLSRVKNTLLYSASADRIFWNAVKRVDYFWGLSDIEYSYLKKHFNSLPQFLQVPYRKVTMNEVQANKDLIILSHSKDIYGNHLEVIKGLSEIPEMGNYEYAMFFSYSEYSKRYTKAVFDSVEKFQSIRVITEFLNTSEYNSIMQRTAALVINSYRQMAMGNVNYSLMNGIKVYLSKKNVMYEWLLREGFFVFSLNDFYHDVRTNNVCLLPEQALANRQAYSKLIENYSVDKCFKKLQSLE